MMDVDALRRRNAKLQTLLEVGKQLGAEQDQGKLLDGILDAVKQVSEADRCSLFVVDPERPGVLTSRIAQGMSSSIIEVQVGKGIAGECAATRRVVNIPDAYQDPRFNKEVDKRSGYVTKCILTVPMLDAEGQCAGVIQALNKTTAPSFTAEDEELLMALGGQAAVTLQNVRLRQDIEKLFEGFIKASVYAIEARDPTTSGHSERVAVLTVGVAEAVNRQPPPAHRDVRFTSEELKETRYAALLHDFGKVGVREHVLVKANKLYPHELDVMKERFDHAKRAAQVHYLAKKVKALEPAGLHGEACDACAKLDREAQDTLEELERFWQFIQQCNRPTVLEEGGFEKLKEIAERGFENLAGERVSLLRPGEVINLSIPRGSLTKEERLEIESHVTHTYKFLKTIPWTRDLKRVPDIAFKHHEKLAGGGYPQNVSADAIPVQTRIMTIADIYDALTASDRPYKKALPHEKALDILSADAKKGMLDQALLDVFVEARVHERLKTVAPGATP